MPDEVVAISQPRKLKEKAVEEFKRFVAIFLYLWVVFGLLSIHTSMVLSQRHLNAEEHTFAIINAFVFAKVLLIGEQLRLGRRYEARPLIYPILHKSFVFSLVLICFHVVESVVAGLWHGHTVLESMPPMFGWNPKGLLGIGFTCFVLLLPFFAFREITRVIGHDQMRALVLGSKQATRGET